MDLVKRGAAAKCQRRGEVGMRKDFDQCAADYQILLDLQFLNPRRPLAPCR